MGRNTTKQMVLAGLFAAMTAVCAWITIPVSDIGITLQTMAVFLTLGLLGGKWGTFSIGVYLLLGAAGLPVFSGFRGGIGILLGVTGGYLWGFLFSGLVYWALSRIGTLPAMVAGQLVCYFCGSAWFSLYAGGGFRAAIAYCVVPYLVFDCVKLWLAHSLPRRLKRHIP